MTPLVHIAIYHLSHFKTTIVNISIKFSKTQVHVPGQICAPFVNRIVTAKIRIDSDS